jgi:predicted nuclease of predicted toxin-antitoxin system
MRFKLDENMPGGVVPDLVAVGHDVHTCAQEGIAGIGDAAISAHASAETRVLISFDLDFADIRAYPPGTHAGIVVLRARRPDLFVAQAALARLLATTDEADFPGNLIVVDENKIRIRRPPTTP